MGFASPVAVPSLETPSHPSLFLSSGPAGDSADSCGFAYAHPGASPDSHVRAGEVSWAVGTEGLPGSGDPWDLR